MAEPLSDEEIERERVFWTNRSARWIATIEARDAEIVRLNAIMAEPVAKGVLQIVAERDHYKAALKLEPVERMVLTIAVSRIERGLEVEPNSTVVLVAALTRISAALVIGIGFSSDWPPEHDEPAQPGPRPRLIEDL